MGAKTASKPRLRSIAYKCDLCGRKFTKLETLKSHQRTVHNLQPKQIKLKSLDGKTNAKAVIKEKKAKITSPTPISSNNNQETEFSNKGEDKQDVVEFECPKCFRTFPKYFPALKHIQRFHCVNREGTKVPANSPFLIQPVRIELCRKCNCKVKSISTHLCGSTMRGIQDVTYTCTACDGSFATLKSFDIHVFSQHGDDTEGFFFPSNTEFTKWKMDMENQTKTKYTLVDKYESKCCYHCNLDSPQSRIDTIKLCPSMIVAQELPKGIKVTLFKCHYKHIFVNYKTANKYKKYGLNVLIQNPDNFADTSDSICKDDDMYIQFKTLMESIIFNAAKVDIYTLKVLLTKALDMTTIITSYEEKSSDNEETYNNKSVSMNESDIVSALMDNNIMKRKSVGELNVDLAKRPRVDETVTTEGMSAPKIINIYSLANENTLKEANKIQNHVNIPKPDTKVDKNVLAVGTDTKPEAILDKTPIQTEKKTPRVLEKPFSSFDESYADFLSKNFVVPKENLNTSTEKRTRSSQNKKEKEKKLVVKTKMGQFKGVSPKKDASSPHNKEISDSNKKELSIPLKKDTPLSTKKDTPLSTKRDTPVSTKKDTPLSTKKDTSLSTKKDTPLSTKRDTPVSTKKDTPVSARKGTPVPVKKDTPLSSKKDTPVSAKKDTPVIIKKVAPVKHSPIVSKKVVANPPKKVINVPKNNVNLKVKSKLKPAAKPRLSFEKPKVDIVYEVKEQEDDCNILILKI